MEVERDRTERSHATQKRAARTLQFNSETGGVDPLQYETGQIPERFEGRSGPDRPAVIRDQMAAVGRAYLVT